MKKKDPKDYGKIKIVMMFISKHYPYLYDKVRAWILNNKSCFKIRPNKPFFSYFSNLCNDIIYEGKYTDDNKELTNLMTSQYYKFLVDNFLMTEAEKKEYTDTSNYFFKNYINKKC